MSSHPSSALCSLTRRASPWSKAFIVSSASTSMAKQESRLGTVIITTIYLLVRMSVRLRHSFANVLSSERPETPPSPLSNVPFPRDPDFVKRGLLSDEIHERLSIPGGRLALYGLGGVG
jgi:hypothetical protein